MNNCYPNYQNYWKSILLIIFTLILSIEIVSGQVSIHKTRIDDREAYTIENKVIRVSMLTGGGYIGEVRLISSDPKKAVNPMRTPHYKTIDPQDYDPIKHDKLYGGGGDRKVMAGYMGHFLCFPYVGGSNSIFEQQLGYEAHGEAAVVKWSVKKAKEVEGAGALIATAKLPLSSYVLKRRITLKPGQSVALVEEEAENLERFDRPYQWVQHVTFGSPFVEYARTFVDAPVSRIAFNQGKYDGLNINTVQWPMVKTLKGDSLNAGIFDMDKGQGVYRAWLMDPGRTHTWFTMYNKNYNVLIGYIFSKEENPWIGDWQENGSKKSMPWNGEAVARGLLVGTSPFTPGVKASIERGPVFNTATYRWIGAKEKIKQSYLIFMVEIDDNFRGVKDLKFEQGAILLVEKETGKQIRIVTDFSL